MFSMDGRYMLAHRVVLQIETGTPVPADKVVMHECDNPSCVRPTHLRVGTHAENMHDKVVKGRSRIHKRNGGFKLPERPTQWTGFIGPKLNRGDFIIG